MQKNKSVKINLIYNTAYQLLAIAIPLITTPYLSRVLGAEKIGVYSYSYSIAYYFAMFILLGLNNYGNRSIAAIKDSKLELSKVFFSIYLMQLTSSVVVIIAYVLYAVSFSNNAMTWILLIYVISAGFDINWFFFGLEEFRLTVIRNTVIKIATTAAIFICVKSPNDIELYGIIMVMGLLLSQLIMWPFVPKYTVFVKPSLNEVIKHIKPNLILFIPVIAVSLYKMMDKIMLGLMSDMKQVGFYENTEKIVQVPMVLVNSLGTVMLPKTANLLARNEETIARKYLKQSIIIAMILASSICFGIMAVAPLFVPWFYGTGYEQCIVLFQILMPSCIFLAFANVIRTQYLIPRKKDTIYIKSVLLGAIVNFTINFILIRYLASSGAAVGTLFAEAAVCVYQAYSVRNEMPINSYIKMTTPFIFFGAIMYMIVLLVPSPFYHTIFNMIFKVLIGVAVFSVELLIYGTVFYRGYIDYILNKLINKKGND